MRRIQQASRAPYDGLLHTLGMSIYTSLTQLLIRRSLFDRIGMFESMWGSIGDFNWGMRAALVTDTLHVAGTWGGWRLHDAQATAQTKRASADGHDRVDDMIRDALERTMEAMPPRLAGAMSTRWIEQTQEMRRFIRFHRNQPGFASRQWFLLTRLLAGSSVARRYLAGKLRGGRPLLENLPGMIRQMLEEESGQPVFEEIPHRAAEPMAVR